MDIKIAREVAARIWCDQEMSSIVMDVELAEEIAQLLSSRPTKDAADGAKAGNLKYWQHDETGRLCVKETRPSPRWYEITQGQYDGSDDDYPAKPPRRRTLK